MTAFSIGAIVGILFGYYYAVAVLKRPYQMLLKKNIEAYREELNRVSGGKK